MVSSVIYDNEYYQITLKPFEAGYTIALINYYENKEEKNRLEIDVKVDLNDTQINHDLSENILLEGLEIFLSKYGDTFRLILDEIIHDTQENSITKFSCSDKKCDKCKSKK